MVLASLLRNTSAAALGTAAAGLEAAATLTRKLAEAVTTDASATTVELATDVAPGGAHEGAPAAARVVALRKPRRRAAADALSVPAPDLADLAQDPGTPPGGEASDRG